MKIDNTIPDFSNITSKKALTEAQLSQISGGSFLGFFKDVGNEIGHVVAGAGEEVASGVTSLGADVGIPGAADATDSLQNTASDNFSDAGQIIQDDPAAGISVT